jgi:hypothetical protein
MNAAEWEDVSIVSRRAAQTPAPAKKEEETPSGILKEETARLFDEKACSLSSNLVFPNTNKENQFVQILAAQKANAAAAADSQIRPHSPSLQRAPERTPQAREPQDKHLLVLGNTQQRLSLHSRRVQRPACAPPRLALRLCEPQNGETDMGRSRWLSSSNSH